MMLALEMYRSLPRHVAGKAVGGRIPGLLSGYAAPLRLMTIDEPAVERPGWARLRTRLSGICGSDLGALSGRTSLYFSGVVSMPFVPGHEVVAELLDDCEDLPAGTRVVIDPVLTCAARGVEPCDACADGATNRCSRITVGHLAPGLQTGFCADTGGGWGEVLTAHRSQLHAVPEGYSDEQAVLTEPMACAVHTALRAGVARQRPGAGQRCRLGRPADDARPAQPHRGRRDHGRRQARPPARARAPARRDRGGRAGRGAAPAAPGDRCVPDQARALAGVPPRRSRHRGRRGRQQAVAGDGAARHPGRWPGRAVRDAAGGRPVRGVVPRAGDRRLLLVGPARGGAGRPERLRRGHPSCSPATRSASWRRPSPATRCTDGARRSTTRTVRAGSVRSRWLSTRGATGEDAREKQ